MLATLIQGIIIIILVVMIIKHLIAYFTQTFSTKMTEKKIIEPKTIPKIEPILDDSVFGSLIIETKRN